MPRSALSAALFLALAGCGGPGEEAQEVKVNVVLRNVAAREGTCVTCPDEGVGMAANYSLESDRVVRHISASRRIRQHEEVLVEAAISGLPGDAATLRVDADGYSATLHREFSLVIPNESGRTFVATFFYSGGYDLRGGWRAP